MLLYIHGFGSSGFSKKARELKRHFGDEEVMAPSLSHIPALAVATLEEILTQLRRCDREVVLVGSSLGGYYATYLAERFDLAAVLVNPSVFPYRTLASHLGSNHSYYDLSDYEWVQSHIDSLKRYEKRRIDPSRYLLLLQKGDEVLDYREALERYRGAKTVVQEGGSHGFDDFAATFSEIEAFLSLWRSSSEISPPRR